MTLNRNLAVTDMFISVYSWGGDVTKVINSNICCIATEGEYPVLREITATKLIELGFVRVIVLPPQISRWSAITVFGIKHYTILSFTCSKTY